jgi:hypothetical protein
LPKSGLNKSGTRNIPGGVVTVLGLGWDLTFLLSLFIQQTFTLSYVFVSASFGLLASCCLQNIRHTKTNI